MPRPRKLPPGTADDAEASFYEALQQADLERMMRCWADEDDISCVHSDGLRMLGRAAVREAFGRLFARGPARVVPERVQRQVFERLAVHSIVERLEHPGDDGWTQVWVLATHVYARTDHGWRLVARHASPGSLEEPRDVSGAPPRLH